MKKSITILFFITTLFAHAQTFDEWFKQKKTQRKYLQEQIVALKVYLGYVKDGYRIAQRGLNTIDNIKNGNFNLHRDFFSSFKNVNPAITNSVKVIDITAFQIGILHDLKKISSFVKGNKNFTVEETHYITKVCTNMLLLCDANLSELLYLVKSGESGLTDDERIGQIDSIYKDMQDQYAFTHDFDNTTQALANARSKELSHLRIFKTW
ncbi:MAG: hypothetical protein ABL895_19865 [Cyclobacteriaceae bacterium]